MITGYEANIRKCMSPEEAAKATAAQEAVLVKREREHQKIFNAWLKARRDEGKLWFISPQMHKPSTIEPGHPDYSIFLSGGRMLLIEMKVDGGKVSDVQNQAFQKLFFLGHQIKLAYGHDQAIRFVQLLLSVAVKS